MIITPTQLSTRPISAAVRESKPVNGSDDPEPLEVVLPLGLVVVAVGVPTRNAKATVSAEPRSCKVCAPSERSLGTVKGYETRPPSLATEPLRMRGVEYSVAPMSSPGSNPVAFTVTCCPRTRSGLLAKGSPAASVAMSVPAAATGTGV